MPQPFRSLSDQVRWFVIVLVALYVAIVLLLFPPNSTIVAAVLVAIFAAACIVRPTPHPLGGIHDPISGVVITAALLWPPETILLGVGFGCLIGLVSFRGSELWRASMNSTGWALTGAAAAWMAQLVLGSMGTGATSLTIAAVVAVATNRFTNTGMFAIYRSYRYQHRFLPDWRQSLTYLWPSQFLAAPLAIVLAAAAYRFHNMAVGLALTAAYGLALPVARQEYSYYERSQKTLDETVEAAVRTLEGIDPKAREHGARVGRLAIETGRALGMSEDALLALRLAARLHDIGLLAGPGAAGGGDHAIVGSRILATFPDPRIAQFVRAHHERWDGRGTPDGKAGTDTPLGARILSAAEIADGYATGVDAFSTAHSDEEVRAYLLSLRGTGLDPKVVDAMRGAIAKGNWKKEPEP